MYNHFRRCLIVSTKIHRKLLMQESSHESILLPVIDCYASSRCIWNNTVYKRVYCQIANNEKTDEASVMKSDVQQKPDDFLSNPEDIKRYQILELEIDVMRNDAEKVPEKLNPDNWLLLLKLPSKRQRKKYLYYLWCNETHKKNEKMRKELKKAKWHAEKAEAEVQQTKDTGKIKYGLTYNSIFMRINSTTMNHYYNAKLMQAIMFAPKVVFDCSYESYMNFHQIHNCAKQLTLSFANNRAHVDPMCLYYCNLNKDGLLMEYFQRNIPTLLNDDFPAIVTSQSYLDLFRKDQLLYLTPHCKTDITEYDPDTVYIIGAMIDTTNSEPLSLAKAKKDGIRMGKLPLERYMEWGPSSCKRFSIDQMINILLDLRYTGNWKKALRHVPNRKLKESREFKLQKQLRRYLYLQKIGIQESPAIEKNFTYNSKKSNDCRVDCTS
ncbi:Mitochondrial ribonuclease P protein 1-like protein [Formica fusca]